MFPQRHSVHVPRRLRNKVVKVDQELAEQGVDVHTSAHTQRKTKSAGFSIHASWETLGHVWLAFNIGKTAVGAWPKIRKILVNGGLRNDEITTLGLSKVTRQPKKKTRKKR